MTDHSELVKDWIHAKIHWETRSSKLLVDHAHSTSTTESVVDNIPLVLELVGQLTNLAEKAPFIGPIAALMSGILQSYREGKDADGKRDALFTHITDLTGDLCATVLRAEATHHVDLIGRLKADIEAYAGLLEKTSAFIKEYDKQSAVIRFAARNQLAGKLSALTQDLDLFAARFRTNRLVDLALNQTVNTGMLENVQQMALEEKLQKWLNPPDMKLKQFQTQKLRQEGTGLWLLDGAQFIEWQDHPGCLWIRGPSGAGKSVLSSAVISKLIADPQPFDPERTTPVAYFYFDFKDKEAHGQAVDRALQHIILQLSAHSLNPYKVLDKQFMMSKGQTLPTYQDLQKILETLLLELGRTYIVDDDPAAYPDHESTRRMFAEHFKGVTCIDLDPYVTQQDLRLFVSNELGSSDMWAPQVDHIADRVVRKSNGMFRLAACLLVELGRCQYQDELEETLDNLPDDLFGIYDRFLQPIRPKDFIYVRGALQWLIFSSEPLNLDQLADAISFDISKSEEFTYKPSRRPDNAAAILKWLEGLVVLKDYYGESWHVLLAHASVQDYALSERFTKSFGLDLSQGPSHTFIARTCISYLLHISAHPLNDISYTYPLARYAAMYWWHHLLRSYDRSGLFSGAMRLLEEGSAPYLALVRLHEASRPLNVPSSPLELCCQEGYMEGVRGLLENGADANAHDGRALQGATGKGHTDIVQILLEKGADINAQDGSALQAASAGGHGDTVHLLLEKGADMKVTGGTYGNPLVAASVWGHTEISRLLLEHGADVNECYPLQAACGNGYPETVQLLLENGADVNAGDNPHGSPLHVAARYGRTDIVRLLLKNGADVNASGALGSALQAASTTPGDYTDLVQLLLDSGADANARGEWYGSALHAACSSGNIGVVQLLLEHGANVNAAGGRNGTALQAASRSGHTALVELLLEKEADVNTAGGKHDSALQTASAGGHTSIVSLLLKKGADVSASGGQYGSALQAASAQGHTEIVSLLLSNGAQSDMDGESASALRPASRKNQIRGNFPEYSAVSESE
ncbi:ankyrin repeat-containing domain protein [Mycena vulgaris]|nr:ankyrin repeat-containing domain protein [Mycena vulgaris]